MTAFQQFWSDVYRDLAQLNDRKTIEALREENERLHEENRQLRHIVDIYRHGSE